jgi:type I restriction enzyme, S subunit
MQMKPYPKYKDSGIEWIGEIPDGWEVHKLKHLGDAMIGIIYSPTEIVQDSGVLVLRASNIQNYKLSLKNCVYVDKEIPNKLKIKKGDILICSRSGSRDLVGKSILINESLKGSTFGTFMTVFRTRSYRFISKYFNSHVFLSQSSLFLTTTINQLTLGTLNNFYVILPPSDEQTYIASYLDSKTVEIDDLIAKSKKLIELEKEKRVALINHAVTKGLDSNVKLKDSGVEWIGKISDGYDVVPLTKFLTNIADYRGKTPEKTGEGVFLVTGKNIKNGNIHYNLSQEYVQKEDYDKIMQRGKPKKGDLLFTTEAPLGEVANVDNPYIALAQRIIKMRTREKVLDNYFLKYYIMTKTFQGFLQSLATGSTALGIKANKLCYLKLILPPKPEQTQIVNYLDKHTANIDKTIQKINKNIELLEEYKQSLIHHVVTGKVDVREVAA